MSCLNPPTTMVARKKTKREESKLFPFKFFSFLQGQMSFFKWTGYEYPCYGPFFWISATPSSTVKTAPHFGHLIFVSLATPAHPNEKTAKSANAKKILINFLITNHLLSPAIWLLNLHQSVAERDINIPNIPSSEFRLSLHRWWRQHHILGI